MILEEAGEETMALKGEIPFPLNHLLPKRIGPQRRRRRPRK